MAVGREKARREFQTSLSHHAALVSLTAGGMGIDLHSATTAVFADVPTSLMWLKQVRTYGITASRGEKIPKLVH